MRLENVGRQRQSRLGRRVKAGGCYPLDLTRGERVRSCAGVANAEKKQAITGHPLRREYNFI